MKTKLEKVENLNPKTQIECWNLLSNGYIFTEKTLDNQFLKIVDGFLTWYYPQYNDTSKIAPELTLSCPDMWEVYEEKEINWYDEISAQGVLCWVRNSPEEAAHLAVVTGYESDNLYCFVTHFEDFRYATPATFEEVKGFLKEFQGEKA